MLTIQRRKVLGGLAGIGAASLGALTSPVWAQPGKVNKLAPRLRIVIPGMSRSSLDEAGRALGDALVTTGLCDEIEYENKEGKGGTLGLAYYTDKYGRDPNSLLIGDTSLVGAIALQKPAVDLSRIQPIARLTSDYLVVVVAGNSSVKTITELTERLRNSPKQTPIAIGSMGGVDHVFAGLLTKSAGSSPDDASYLSFSRGFEMVDAVIGGKAAAGISGYNTFAADLASGKLRAIGVSSRRGSYGLRSVREQGIDVDMTNWRAVFTGQGVAAPRQVEMAEAVKMAIADESWKKTLKQSYWESFWLAGPDLSSFIDLDMKTAPVVAQLLKLKA
ncbi:MAG: tripartite tricarboxylate transporter substrate-binding protein [Pseudomonadota bacterium]